MTNLEKQLLNFQKSDKYKKIIADKSKQDKNFGKSNGSGGTESLAKQYGLKMKEILLKEINTLDSASAIERFTNAIVVEPKFINGIGWIVDIRFDEDEVTSNSLWWQNQSYEIGAYLPSIFNNGYTAKNYVYGKNNNGESMRSKLSRSPIPFIQNAINRFNAEFSKTGTRAECNEIYGGTLERGGLASIYF